MTKPRNLRFIPENSVYSQMNSPVGQLTIITSKDGLHAVLWDCDLQSLNWQQTLTTLIHNNNEENIVKTKEQLNEYFKGIRKTFNVPLAPRGTDFQLLAWKELLQIPYAHTISYATQAERVGNRNKARAVGMANSLNPISIIIPCHRVVGTNGALVGFAGGLDKKQYLLKLEQDNNSFN